MESLVSKVIQALKSKNFAQATFCDLSKTFDIVVDYTTLLHKFVAYGRLAVRLRKTADKLSSPRAAPAEWRREAVKKRPVPIDEPGGILPLRNLGSGGWAGGGIECLF
ncbi:hypothetical protein J6590_027780 [Homalodisca vitripennis]|nr:hypothetical protein J6590_027780 [Homalodisca vitripennis]